MSSASVVILFFENNDLSDGLVIKVSEVAELIFHAVALIYSIILVFIIRKNSQFNYQINQDQQFINIEKQIDFIFLVVSNLFLLVYCLLLAIGSILSLSNDKTIANELKYLKLIDATLPFLQSILQVLIIWTISTRITLFKGFIQIFTLLNFALWLFDTFSATKHELSQIQSAVYGHGGWEIIGSIFIPLSIFYRFHSCVLLVKINSNKYSEIH